MKLDLQFLRSPTGQLVVVGVLAAVAAGAIGWQRSRRKPVTVPAVKTTAAALLPTVFQRPGARFETPATVVPASPVTPPVAPALPAAPPILPLTVFAANPHPKQSGAPRHLPYGRLIPCETVVSLESNQLETPVIGLVTVGVWENGQCVIPVGAEVHGQATLDRTRERIAVQGRWTIVWRTRDQDNGTELHVNGIALNREISSQDGELDGTAGLRGMVLHNARGKEAKLFAATFLANAATALQDTHASAGLLGETAVPAATVRNASLAGTSALMREYADQLRAAVAKDGCYVRVPAGKPFYLYVTQTIGPDNAIATTRVVTPPS